MLPLNLKNFIILLCFFLLFFIILPNETNAVFFDSFENNLSSWEIFSGDWEIASNYNNQVLKNTINSNDERNKIMFLPNETFDDFILEFDIYVEEGIDQHIDFAINEDYSSYYSINFGFKIPPYGGRCFFMKWEDNVHVSSERGYYIFYPRNWYKIKVRKKKERILVHVKERGEASYELLFDETIDNNLTGRLGFSTWTGAYGKNLVYFDNFKVERTGSVTRNPIIFLPGHGGSWCWEGILFNNECEWKKTPFVHVYDNFRNTLLESGYQEDEDYFEFYYDWRADVNQSADKLDNFVSNRVLAQKDEDVQVDLVGHSMGGLVARTFTQDVENVYENEDKVNKVVTVGSPHQGALAAYRGWEGGQTTEWPSWRRLAFEILVQVHKDIYQTRVEAVRELAPSTKQMIPIFDFLKKEEVVVPADDLKEKNNFLFGLKDDLTDSMKDLFSFVNGEGEETVEYYQVKKPNYLDRLLGKWEDGKVVEREISTSGDGTVLLKGAGLDGVEENILQMGHTDLIETEEGIETILHRLGINGEAQTGSEQPKLIPAVVYIMRSPAKMTLSYSGEDDKKTVGYGVEKTLGNSWYFEDQNAEMIIVYNAEDGDYNLKLTGTDDGEYHLDIGYLYENSSDWETITRKIRKNEEKSYKFAFSSGVDHPTVIGSFNSKEYVQLAIKELKDLKNYISNKNDINIKNELIWQIDLILKKLEQIGKKADSKKVLLIQQSLKMLADLNFSVNQLEVNQKTFCKNEISKVESLLNNAGFKFWQSTNKNVSQKRVDRIFNDADTLYSEIKPEVDELSNDGENFTVGKLWNGILESKNKAENSTGFKKWLYSFSNRINLKKASLFFKPR